VDLAYAAYILKKLMDLAQFTTCTPQQKESKPSRNTHHKAVSISMQWIAF